MFFKFTLSAATILLVCAASPGTLHSQSCCLSPVFDLLKVQTMSLEFYRTQLEYRASRDRERRNVPLYNVRLNGAVIAFHKHISKDDHYLVKNCGICRKHLDQIRSYSKKLDRAMK